jgi:hypothetical protein
MAHASKGVEQALFRGATLTIENPKYRDVVGRLAEVLLDRDLSPCDLTIESLEVRYRHASRNSGPGARYRGTRWDGKRP